MTIYALGKIEMGSKSIQHTAKFKFKYSFCSLVTDVSEYHEMVASAKKAGFDEGAEFLFIDNSIKNEFDGFSGYNRFLMEAQGEFIIFCHQDILFEFDDRQALEKRIDEMTHMHPKWAILGNAGKSRTGHSIVRITDPGATNLRQGAFPTQVMSVDENLMIIKREANIACSSQLSGFHLYATDLCQNAEYLGYECFVIDFHLRHKSAGNPNQSYFAVQDQLKSLYKYRKRTQIIQAMCSRFLVSSSFILMLLGNQKWLLNLHKSLSKKIDKSGL